MASSASSATGLASTVFDTAHLDLVHDAQFDFYGQRVATCSSDRVVKVFQVETVERGEDRYTQTGEIAMHEGPVWQVAWAHPQFGSLLATCGYDKRVMVFRESGGSGAPGNWVRVFNYEEHASSVNSIAWAPPELGLHLACASSDGSVTVLSHRAADDGWDVARLKDCPGGVMAVSWAPAAASGAAGAPPTLATAGCDGRVRMWRASAGAGAAGGGCSLAWEEGPYFSEPLVEGGSAAEWVRDVAWCPVGLPEAGGGQGQLLAACSDSGRVALWRSGERRPTYLPPFSAPVWRLGWSPTGRMLAVSCGDNSVTLWKEDMAGTWMNVCNAPVQ